EAGDDHWRSLPQRNLRGADAHRRSHERTAGVNVPPWASRPRISVVRAEQGATFSGVMLSCSASTRGRASTGPATWLSVVQTPAGGEIVSMNPMPAMTGALMRGAKLTVSK